MEGAAGARIEATVWLFGVVVALVAAAIPGRLVQVLGFGRVVPPRKALLLLRVLGMLCAVAWTFRVIELLRRSSYYP